MWAVLPRHWEVTWKQWDPSAKHWGRLKGTGRWCSSASACSAQVAPSTTFLWLLGARGSNQDYGWWLAAVVGKEGMGQREIRKHLQNYASEVYSNNLCLRKLI